jgi:hypothetical protein
MNNFRKTEDFDLMIESRLEWNALLTSEIEALRRLEHLGTETRNYVPTLIQQEIERRKEFLRELINNF